MSRAEALRYIIAGNLEREQEERCECGAGPDTACDEGCGLTNDDESPEYNDDKWWRELDTDYEIWKEMQ